MANDQQIDVNVRLDTGNIDLSIREVSIGVNKLVSILAQIQAQNFEGFKTSIQEVQQSNKNVLTLGTATADASKMIVTAWNLSVMSIVAELKNILKTVEEIKAIIDQVTVEEATTVAANVTGIIADMNTLFDLSDKQGGERGGQLSLPPGKSGGPTGGNASSGGFSGGATGNVGGLFFDGMSADTMSAGMDTVIGKLKEMATAWTTQTAAKAADLAEDAKIIAMNTIEHVKSFGTMVAEIAKATAAWLADTAAKVANTAAQWAQNAATIAWQVICAAATAVTTAFGAAVAFLTSPIGMVIVAITALIAIVVLLVQNWDTVSAAAQRVWGYVQQKFEVFTTFLQNIFAKDWTETFGAFGHVLNGFFTNVENIWNAVKSIFEGIVGFVENVFAGNWKGAWESVKQIISGVWDGIVAAVKTPINSIIGFINGMVSGVVSGVNGIIRVLNGLRFTIPDWVPGFGGSSFGFNIQPLAAPQIPYLARGAVLPANKPFMAVVGDQRHGTNVEAPLTTIQEAVALVMEEHISAMMAGFQALLEEQRATRRTIECIEVGDSVIGQAAERYNTKMAIVRGG